MDSKVEAQKKVYDRKIINKDLKRRYDVYKTDIATRNIKKDKGIIISPYK